MKNETTIGGITVGGQPTAEELTSGRFATVVNIRGSAEEGNITAAALAGTGRRLHARAVDDRHGDERTTSRAFAKRSTTPEGPVLVH